jgi:hypothetical protein
MSCGEPEAELIFLKSQPNRTFPIFLGQFLMGIN